MRYTRKVLVDGTKVNCGSDDKCYLERELSYYRNITQNELLRDYSSFAPISNIQVLIYKKNKNGRVDKSLPKKLISVFTYDLKQGGYSEKIYKKVVDK